MREKDWSQQARSHHTWSGPNHQKTYKRLYAFLDVVKTFRSV